MNDSSTRAVGLPAERMRRHRQRRRDGFLCVVVELHETEVDALIRMQLLKPETRHSRNAVINALHAFLDLALV
jgi:hypothetical protein